MTQPDNLFIYVLNLNIPQINSESKAKFDDHLSLTKKTESHCTDTEQKIPAEVFFSSAFPTASLSF